VGRIIKGGANRINTQERVIIFVDGSNLYHSLKFHFKRTDIDIGRFCQKVLGNRKLIRVYYYNALVSQKEEPERYADQQKFLATIEAIPYFELKMGRLVYNNWPGTPPYEKGVDIMLATDMLTHAYSDNYDTALLVAGDSDYVYALQAVKNAGKHVEITLFGKENTSVPLRKVADKVVPVDGRFLRGAWKKPLNGKQVKQKKQTKQ
jgi:uncharacterized LabA/DUF88 family protein